MKHNTRRAPFARREMAELEELFVKEFYEGFGERNAGELSRIKRVPDFRIPFPDALHEPFRKKRRQIGSPAGADGEFL